MTLYFNSIGIGNIQKQKCLTFEQPPCTCNFFGKRAFTTFFKVLAFPQFLRCDCEIDMICHAWMEYDSLKKSRRWNERFGF